MMMTSNFFIKPISKFLACMIGTGAMCLGAYALTVDSLVQDTDLPSSYKWFLLKHVPGPRLIFESGSNTHHAIDTDMIGEALGMSAINIADNGGYALEDKIARLERYTRAGDIVVLPLEWTFYHREQLTDNYAETLFTDNRDYYRSMSVLKRVKRALSLPPVKVISEISKVKLRLKRETNSPAQDLYIAALTQPSGHQSRATSIGPGLGVDEQSCDDYILGKLAQRKQLKLGANIRPILARLRRLNRRGVKIHFAWPAIAGEGCMNDSAYVSGFRTEIERAVNQAGFEFLAAPSQSLYGQEVQDDSPYHLTTEGTKQHTEKMITYLKAQGYGQSGASFNIKAFARHRLLEMELAHAKPAEQSAFPMNQLIRMDEPESRHYTEFSAGWWGFEPYGRWMRDNRAMFRITLPADTPANAVLEIKGITKSGQAEQVNISIEGEVVNSGLFGNSAPLWLPTKGLPREEVLSIFLTLPKAGEPQSPFERGENQDARSMTLHIQSILLSVQAPQKPSANSRDVVISKPIAFAQGWWPKEAAGRWMKSQQAALKLTLPETKSEQAMARYQLKVRGDFFQGQAQPMSIDIAGQQIQAFERNDDGSYVAFFDILNEARIIDVTLTLSGEPPQSPKSLGLANDERTLTYFLKSVELIPA